MADNVRKLDSRVTDPAKVDEFTDRLFVRRERFSYFVATASTAVIVFTFNNFRQPDGVLRLGPDFVTVLAWFFFSFAALCSLLLIPVRHARYWRFLQEQEAGRRLPPPHDKSEKVTGRLIDRLQGAMAGFFGLGVLLLVISALIGVGKL